MRVYLLGYFHSGAFADDLIELATCRLLQQTGISPLAVLDKKTNPHPASGPEVAEFFNREADLVLFCGGSLLGRLRLAPFHRIETWIDKLQVPLVVLGTGWREEARPLTPEEVDRMRLLVDHAAAIYVRGKHTVERMAAHGLPVDRVIPLGDPGLTYTGNGIPTRRDQYRVGVVCRQMADVEIAQDPSTLGNDAWHARLATLLAHIVETEGAKPVFFPMSTLHRTHDNDWTATARVFNRLNLPESPYIYNECLKGDSPGAPFHAPGILATILGTMDFVISQRLHGSLVSIAHGVPVLVIEYQFGKMADSLSIDGFEELRRLITPQAEVSVAAYEAKRASLVELAPHNRRVCERVRAEYVRALSSLAGEVIGAKKN